MNERGIDLAHTTILRWVQHYTPEFEKRWNRYGRSVGGSWRCDETYLKVKGEWMYLYRAVDKAGKTVKFYLSRKRNVNAAKAFLRKAMRAQRIPTKITLDAYAASHRAVADLKDTSELPRRVLVRSCKYLNNIVEQDHRRVTQRLRPMLGLRKLPTQCTILTSALGERHQEKRHPKPPCHRPYSDRRPVAAGAMDCDAAVTQNFVKAFPQVFERNIHTASDVPVRPLAGFLHIE